MEHAFGRAVPLIQRTKAEAKKTPSRTQEEASITSAISTPTSIEEDASNDEAFRREASKEDVLVEAEAIHRNNKEHSDTSTIATTPSYRTSQDSDSHATNESYHFETHYQGGYHYHSY